MKNLKLTIIAAFISLFSFQSSGQVHVSIFTSIPIAPNISLNVGITTPQPRYDAIWIDGFWTFDIRTGSYVWVQGYWAFPPHPGAVWMPGYWNHTSRGYVWVDACWTPRNYVVPHGYFKGRFDYYGRPVYYHKPQRAYKYGYAYKYDHRPEYRGNSYSSNPRFNNNVRNESKSGRRNNSSNSTYNNTNNNRNDNYSSSSSKTNSSSKSNNGRSVLLKAPGKEFQHQLHPGEAPVRL